jgi:hypothetical protein
MDNNNFRDVYIAQCKFGTFVRNNLRFPEIQNVYERSFCVPLSFIILPDGKTDDIIYDASGQRKQRMFSSRIETKFTGKPEFEIAAIEVVKSYKGWIPFSLNGEYVEKRMQVKIYFSYHTQYIENIGETIVLNPTKRAQPPENNRSYEYLIEGIYGCDGIANVLFIIEKNGELTYFECLGAEGKTNCQNMISELLSLGNWTPAENNGVSVRSQMELLLYG